MPFPFFNRKRSANSSIQDKNIDGDVLNNSNFDVFNTVKSEIDDIISRRSVVTTTESNFSRLGFATQSYDITLNALDALPLLTDKPRRIAQYRSIASFPECSWCIDEIADDFLHQNEKGEFITLTLPETKPNFNEENVGIINNEFKKFIDLFNLKDNGFKMMRKFVTEGEVAYENIINPKYPELGIVGVKYLPTEFYETLIQRETGNKIGLYFNAKNHREELKQWLSQSYFMARTVFDNVIGVTNMGTYRTDDCVPLLWPQVTYFSSDDLSTDGLIVFPLIEKCKQAYHQLVLLHDAAVILRVTRAPERLLFNISTGGLTQKKAEEYVRQFGNRLKSKKVVSNPAGPGGPNIQGIYDPVSMLEAYVFGKSNANDGTNVETVGSSASYEQIDDIKYFLKRLLKQFKVPFTRFEAPESMNEQAESMSYEEYSFSRMIIRLQRRFALGFKKSFIVHLKLRGIWEKYSLKESDIDINFVPPVLYDLYQVQKLMEAKIAAYQTLGDRDEFSKITAMKNILHMTDDEIKENYDNLAKEKALMQRAEHVGDKVGEEGADKIIDKLKVDTELPQLDSEEGEEGEGGESSEGGEESPSKGESEESGGESAPGGFGFGG